MGGFESILNGATVYITNIIAALLINSIGSTEYFKKLALKGEELAQTQKLFTEQAATPSSSFFMDATYVILSLVLYAAIATLLNMPFQPEKNSGRLLLLFSTLQDMYRFTCETLTSIKVR